MSDTSVPPDAVAPRRWFQTLVVGQPYFAVGFVDEKLTVPAIASFIYLGVGALEGTGDEHCFQDAYSWLHPDESAESGHEPNYAVMPDASLEMIADKEGLIAWLQSSHSTTAGAEADAG